MTPISEEPRRFLEIASVIGQQVQLDVWQLVAGMSDEELMVIGDQACSLHVLEDAPERDHMSFVHALTRETIYRSISPPRRRRWHRLVGETLAGTPNPSPDSVAYHFQQAGDERSVEWLVRAGLRARRSAAWLTAADRFSTAATLLEGDNERVRERSWFLFYACFLRRYIDDDQRLNVLNEVERLATGTGDRLLAAFTLYHRGTFWCHRGDLRRGVQEIEKGVAALEELQTHRQIRDTDVESLAVIESMLPETDSRLADLSATVVRTPNIVPQRGILIHWLALSGRFSEALVMGEAFLAEITAELGQEFMRNMSCLSGMLGLAHAYAALGRPDDSLEMYRLAADGFNAVGDYAMVEASCVNKLLMVLVPYLTDRRVARRQAAAEAIQAWQRASGEAAGEGKNSRIEFLVDFLDGRWEEANQIALPHYALKFTRTMQFIFAQGLPALYQGQSELARAQVAQAFPEGPSTEPGDDWFPLAMAAQLLAVELGFHSGDLAAARAWLESLDRWLQWSGAFLWRAENRLLRARYHLLAGDVAAARQHAHLAMELASHPRQPLALLSTHRFLGELDTNAGDLKAAETHLRESLQLAEACAVPFERALTLLALAELRVATRQVAEAESLLAEVEEICVPLDAKPTLARAQGLATQLATRVPKHANPFGLTRREVEVLRLLVQGMSDREIGEALFISRHTAMRHVSHILAKLDVDSRTAAAALAVRNHIV